MSKKLSYREKVIMVVCVLMGIVYLCFIGIIKPLNARITRLDTQIRSKRIRLSKNERILEKAVLVEKEYASLIDSFKQKESNEQVMSGLLSEIEGIAKNKNINISELKPRKVRKSDYYNQFSISVSLSSQFSEIVEFLYILQSKPYLFKVDEISLDRGSRRKNTLVKSRFILSKILIPEVE